MSGGCWRVRAASASTCSRTRGGGGTAEAAGEPAGGLPQAGGLLAAGVAPGEVPLEPHPVRLGERVKRVRAGQGVRDLPPDPHEPSPRQSRSRISPSRMRVFTVPTATPSRPATSR